MSGKEWTEYEQSAVLKVIQRALDEGAIPPEDRAAVVRAKKRLEDVSIRRYPARKQEPKPRDWEW